MRKVRYLRGETIFNIGDEGGLLVYIYSGETKCSLIYPDGVMSELDYAPSPAFYGEMELLGIQKYTSLVTAVTESSAYEIDTTLCRDLLLSDPVFLRTLAGYVSLKLLRVNMQMARNVSFPLRRRLSSYILSHEKNGLYMMSHLETAQYLCVSYRQLLNVMSSLEKDGILRRERRGCYRIISSEALLREAGEC